MRTKKLLAAGLACAALAAMLVVTVSAHGCHGGRRSGHHGGEERQAMNEEYGRPFGVTKEGEAVRALTLDNGVLSCEANLTQEYLDIFQGKLAKHGGKSAGVWAC